MSNIPFELDRQPGRPNLSAADLSGLGKQASNLYLGGECSLNDAVVKVAQEHPGITSHQVRRVLEAANRCTFQEMFEKQAGDKNIEFPIADPEVVLQALEKTAEAPQSVFDLEYSMEPVKVASAQDLEADLALCDVFGVDVSTSAMEKIAGDMPPFLEQDRPEKVKEIYSALKRDHPDMPAEMKARIAARQGKRGKQKQGPPYEGPITAEYKSKKAELLGEALGFVKGAQDKGGLVEDDLRSGVSLESIKEATAASPYPDHNPHGELFRTKQRMEKTARDCMVAAERNFLMTKEAAQDLHHAISQEVLGGRSFGEIVHAMNHVADEGWVKRAMEEVMPMMAAKGIDLTALRAESIRYEMEKGASARVPNPDNPILEAFGSFIKLASQQPNLDGAFRYTQDMLDQLNSAVQRVLEAPDVNQGQ